MNTVQFLFETPYNLQFLSETRTILLDNTMPLTSLSHHIPLIRPFMITEIAHQHRRYIPYGAPRVSIILPIACIPDVAVCDVDLAGGVRVSEYTAGNDGH